MESLSSLQTLLKLFQEIMQFLALLSREWLKHYPLKSFISKVNAKIMKQQKNF